MPNDPEMVYRDNAPPLPNHFDLPYRLRRLVDLAYNLWWSWQPGGDRIFRRLDPELWERMGHNPVRFLREIERKRLSSATKDPIYLRRYDRMVQQFDEALYGRDSWYSQTYPEHADRPIAYFSTEFGLHESLPIYAGGLGVLSGDTLKEASDLGLPLIAVGFLYTQGYFVQRITEDGWQEAIYTDLAFPNLPVFPELDDSGQPQLVSVGLPGREVFARLWRVQVGRVPLYLLDSNVELNQPSDRDLTARLYTSDLELRISQEIVLGIGGVRALRTLGYNPAVWHMNEGHSAFLNLERIRELIDSGRSFDTALEQVRASTVFTTHTPVQAGNDEFPLWLMDKYFSNYYPKLEIERDAFIDLGRQDRDWGEVFSMVVLAMRISGRRNGVSELHGRIARRMWSHLWPEREISEVPIHHITNGIHTHTWLSRRLRLLFDAYLGEDWPKRLDDPETWAGIEAIPDRELWTIRRHLKRRLVAYMRERARKQWQRGLVSPIQAIASGVLLDPYALTIAFARRFATYKRADLILRDPERLRAILCNRERPVQVIFAGKAHPADEPGKRLIQQVYAQVKKAEFSGRLVFLEDYDVNLARYLVQGVDVWLNTPRRPHEASGTSGQKAAVNGALNLSVLDGWWPEGFNGINGWAIGDQEQYKDPGAQDAADAESLYTLLEQEVVPLYYDRSADDLPSEWLGKVKHSIQSLAPQFSTRRMMKAYIEDMYQNAASSEQEQKVVDAHA
jgi:starch phosphorylase